MWSVKNGDPKKGETGTSAPLVVKDKVLVGISGGEFGVQARVTAYNIKDGSLAWKAYSEGPDNGTRRHESFLATSVIFSPLPSRERGWG